MSSRGTKRASSDNEPTTRKSRRLAKDEEEEEVLDALPEDYSDPEDDEEDSEVEDKGDDDDDDDDEEDEDDEEQEEEPKKGDKRKPSKKDDAEEEEGDDDEEPEDDDEEGDDGEDDGAEEEGEDAAGDDDDDEAADSDAEPIDDDEFKAQRQEIRLDQATLNRLKTNLQAVEAKRAASKTKTKTERGVLYVGHIPYGFYEEQMRRFFSQFGNVYRLRMSRNKKTGRSRGFAFVEFGDRVVAQTVAETMNNYLIFGRLLQCQLLDKKDVHPQTFKNAKNEFRHISYSLNEKARHNKERDLVQEGNRALKLISKQEMVRARLEAAGIDYDFGGYASNLPEGVSQ
ncbi:hypothetical protein CAOG_08620 [Capsaspora owczarzaki ATCC 30864]|uniref:RRM domain-containing protein n=1 Tax=Capsaspora owczarzaki (strain ATCC 30864) TaxID=595528 RepID=A0A0D2WML3_CAPO3|nr:hypothetical protein CAOG_08620 [Capsaspora owczarzaki ATCC 30864]KJE91443.1 hypothetical protein CAOG_008620 [Capsaspora owczarzaki ATCC 30864]|eukprot:XP_011270220.1 hypothetical protein CAOG_08620 [Capsaspora owczarzaki ATCC 30864]